MPGIGTGIPDETTTIREGRIHGEFARIGVTLHAAAAAADDVECEDLLSCPGDKSGPVAKLGIFDHQLIGVCSSLRDIAKGTIEIDRQRARRPQHETWLPIHKSRPHGGVRR